MSRTLLSLTLPASLLCTAAFADVPDVAADIAPVHSLVARVMDGVGTPSLIVQSGASPHEYSLRPSEARALQEADLVFWIGPDLTPWLDDAIGTLATNAAVTELLEADGTIELELREGALFEAHDHNSHAGEEHDDHDDHDDDHSDHDDHDDEHYDHDDHDDHEDEHEGHDDHAGHDHGEHDPHAWLSVQNAATWLNVIAGQLSAADPENAGAYFANASTGRAELQALTDEVNAMLEPVRDGQFIVFHDAYQYFEVDFDLTAAGAISISDASDPSPARITEIRGRVADQGIDCVLAEPQFNPGLVATILDGTEAQTGILDPLGSDLEPGANLYPQMIRNLASALVGCM
ncbi:zinc transport system substrate-binding protein [Monaibacterium marinum]|uniref:High-affinity zinc uptake system protein ZnuA n=1 Tax=Pontivivens marinum TaxID=1690039 RepID=A0A2C9CR07_9RHOB|nr:zinc ABC transporter substrate-binding protein [Monaibacterium marinum]SOH93796.1 zinc transport system substrate-binding protein [Monaibacterium marinum]